MSDVSIRKEGRAGRITLTRAKALNALSHAMVQEIDAAVVAWIDDPEVAVVVIDAEGDKAFCAGGDIAEVYRAGVTGDFAPGQEFWREEYAMNLRLGGYPKPVVSFMQGFVMGGGVGLGCHVATRVVGETTQMSMPECGIGLIPDVGGTHLLSRAPGRLGVYLGLTGTRMGPGDAVAAGFADLVVPEAQWPALIARIVAEGDLAALEGAGIEVDAPLAAARAEIDALFAGDLAAITAQLAGASGALAESASKALARGSPLSEACTLRLLDQARAEPGLAGCLIREFRFTARACERSDFLEGVRAQLIDKDRNPVWMHAGGAAPEEMVAALVAPLGADELILEDNA